MAGFSEQTVERFAASLAAGTAAPGGGAAAAVACALSAALVEMAGALSRDGEAEGRMRELCDRAAAARSRALRLADEDAAAYTAVLAAQRLPATGPGRGERIAGALSGAADVPLALAQEAAELAELAAEVIAVGNPSLRGDALAGALLAEAAGAAATRLVEINLAGAAGDPRLERASGLAVRAHAARQQALGA